MSFSFDYVFYLQYETDATLQNEFFALKIENDFLIEEKQ